MNDRARRAVLVLVCALAAVAGVSDAFAEFALLGPAKDATLFEDPAGALASGSGESIFAGRINTSSRSIRRALLAFDVADAIPAGSTVTGATLWLNLGSTSAGPVAVRLHRVASDWGEGAAASGGGGGAPAQPGDATWIHRYFADTFWAQPGGDLDPIPRAEAIVDQAGAYFWGSTPEMVADVQSWLDEPASAFGWILLGDESRSQTVKRFDSRESADGAVRPLLEVDFIPPCAPNPAGPGYWQRQCADLGGEGLEWVVPCARRLLDDLGLPEIVACDAVLAPPPRDCRARAERKLAVLVLNVCAARLQTSCPVDASADGCSGGSVGDLLLEISALLREGDCRRASGCGGDAD
jgi:hypothetical protein